MQVELYIHVHTTKFTFKFAFTLAFKVYILSVRAFSSFAPNTKARVTPFLTGKNVQALMGINAISAIFKH